MRRCMTHFTRRNWRVRIETKNLPICYWCGSDFTRRNWRVRIETAVIPADDSSECQYNLAGPNS